MRAREKCGFGDKLRPKADFIWLFGEKTSFSSGKRRSFQKNFDTLPVVFGTEREGYAPVSTGNRKTNHKNQNHKNFESKRNDKI